MKKEHCYFLQGDDDKYDICIIHGFKSRKERKKGLAKVLNSKGYNVLCCDLIGHGTRKKEGTYTKVFDSLLELEDIIKQNGRKMVLIGHSMGGAIALSLGIRNPEVEKIFAIGAPYGRMNDRKDRMLKLSLLLRTDFLNASEEGYRQILRVMPMVYGECKMVDPNRFYLIYTKNDGFVEYNEFLRNKDMLCVPDKNILLYKFITGNGELDHILIGNDSRTIDFILKNLGDE